MTDYKTYSLEKLGDWIHDALSCADATPKEIYDAIKEAIEEDHSCYTKGVEKTSQLLSLFGVENNSTKSIINEGVIDFTNLGSSDTFTFNTGTDNYTFPESMNVWTDDKINFSVTNSNKERDREYNLREVEYYNKRAKLDANPGPHQDYIGWENVSDDEFNKMFPKKDKVVKWQLPIKVDGLTGDCYFNIPDDLLERAGLKEGDTVEWIDRKDGSFEMRKVTKLIRMDEC